ncbi:hypothetical protein TD95_000833 [Thielaviopsis punctulata]|uniref:BIR-domain-containing protein n=1 Tax=Thielaviopsis punctulata TaxID=72032 RepID=A0A0F4ZK74_9PEZI|nr:hypothetical protein TD95_000833 [Thielaviopsis punctulata]
MVCHVDFVTYDARLASFTNPKRRAAGTNGRAGKVMRWPHASIRPEDMAASGMFFDPAATNPDHTICFHCGKGLDGWEAGDNPFNEHLKHSRSCGWAILVAAEYAIDGYDELDPLDPGLVAARKETFEGVWPHENSKGWKCKSKQLVDSGWVYTPTLESSDMATCLYCGLAVDGWEPNDKPIHEHESRSANCPFILALKRSKRQRGKASSASTSSSTISIQSNTSMAMSADADDSLMSTVSTTSKRPMRTKKTTTRTRNTRAKKEESVEPESMQIVDAPMTDSEVLPTSAGFLVPDIESGYTSEQAESSSKRGSARGRKRVSEAMEGAAMTEAEAPAPKKNTRKRADSTGSIMSQASSIFMPEPVKKSSRKKAVAASSAAVQRPRSRSSRGSSNASFMSAISNSQGPSYDDQIPDDDELDKQLEADLERFTDEDDIDVSADCDAERRSRLRANNSKNSSLVSERAQTSLPGTNNYAMFDPNPHVSEEVIREELEAMEIDAQTQIQAEAEATVNVEAEVSKPVPEAMTQNSIKVSTPAELELGPLTRYKTDSEPLTVKKVRKTAKATKAKAAKNVKPDEEPVTAKDETSRHSAQSASMAAQRFYEEEDELAGSVSRMSNSVSKGTSSTAGTTKKLKSKSSGRLMNSQGSNSATTVKTGGRMTDDDELEAPLPKKKSTGTKQTASSKLGASSATGSSKPGTSLTASLFTASGTVIKKKSASKASIVDIASANAVFMPPEPTLEAEEELEPVARLEKHGEHHYRNAEPASYKGGFSVQHEDDHEEETHVPFKDLDDEPMHLVQRQATPEISGNIFRRAPQPATPIVLRTSPKTIRHFFSSSPQSEEPTLVSPLVSIPASLAMKPQTNATTTSTTKAISPVPEVPMVVATPVKGIAGPGDSTTPVDTPVAAAAAAIASCPPAASPVIATPAVAAHVVATPVAVTPVTATASAATPAVMVQGMSVSTTAVAQHNASNVSEPSPTSTAAHAYAGAPVSPTTYAATAAAPSPTVAAAAAAAATATAPTPRKAPDSEAGSPVKQNMISNLQTDMPWPGMDVEALFDEFVDKDIEASASGTSAWAHLLEGGELTDAEKEMTVEEWIYHNAAMAEKKMRHECETMVSRFESEGNKAIRTLEGLVTD